MFNGIRTIYPRGLIEVSLKFCMGSQVQHETPEEGWRTHRPKYCEYDNEDNGLNNLSDKENR